MDIIFFQRQTKFLGGKIQQRWAKFVFDDYAWMDAEEINEEAFLQIKDEKGDDLTICGIPVLEQEYANIVSGSAENGVFIAINKLIEDLKNNFQINPEVILSIDVQTFHKVVKKTSSEEFEPKVIVTKTRNMLYYGIFGEDKSILLIAHAVTE